MQYRNAEAPGLGDPTEPFQLMGKTVAREGWVAAMVAA